jgi:hypothetical protein
MIRVYVKGNRPCIVEFNTARYVPKLLLAAQELSKKSGNTPGPARLLDPGERPKKVHTTIQPPSTHIFDDDDVVIINFSRR